MTKTIYFNSGSELIRGMFFSDSLWRNSHREKPAKRKLYWHEEIMTFGAQTLSELNAKDLSKYSDTGDEWRLEKEGVEGVEEGSSAGKRGCYWIWSLKSRDLNDHWLICRDEVAPVGWSFPTWCGEGWQLEIMSRLHYAFSILYWSDVLFSSFI